MQTQEFQQSIYQVLTDNKADQLVTINITQLTDMTDLLMICTAHSTRHAQALCNKIIRMAKSLQYPTLSVEGEGEGTWILADFGSIIVHIMVPEMREFYALEKLWAFSTEKPASNSTATF